MGAVEQGRRLAEQWRAGGRHDDADEMAQLVAFIEARCADVPEPGTPSRP